MALTFSQIDGNPPKKTVGNSDAGCGVFSFYLMLTEAANTGTLLGEKVRLL